MDTSLIDRVARLRGIGDAYHDFRGELRFFSSDTKAALLRAMGCAVDDPAVLAAELGRLERARWGDLLPAVAAVRGARIGVEINVAANELGANLAWKVRLENGERCEGSVRTADCAELSRGEVAGHWVTRRRFDLPLDLPPGYHELEAALVGGAAGVGGEMGVGGAAGRSLLIASPHACFEPAAVSARRLWGMAVQLYTVRSQENWGIGDFGDLKALIRWLAPQGAGFIGLNPLHALSPSDPRRASPYSASSRHFLNLLYVAVPAVAEYGTCAAAKARVADADFVLKLEELRAFPHVDYGGVATLKFEILELVFRDFRKRDVALGSARARAFQGFVADGGPLLRTHALFDALDQHLCATLHCPSGWLNWPVEYRDVNGAAAAAFAAANSERVEFYLYLQWLAHQQLADAQALARELGMPIGLYGDYAVGANPGGSETWGDRTNYRMGAEIGAPPDFLALKGQGWGLPPQDPVVMESQRLQVFVELIRHNMRYYGALRLDHVMSLFRLWWVAAGDSPSAGAYVHYPLDQLAAALALESMRNACLVVGEDLGVVPDEMRRAMAEFGIYHYKVLLFEKVGSRFRRPDEFGSRALATVTTHDMPTLHSYWEGLDIDLRRRLNLYPSEAVEYDVRRERILDRAALLAALQQEGLWPSTATESTEPYSPALAQAMQVYLARSRTILVALQIEDILGMVDPVNVPGTDLEYPNWQRKLTSNLEDMVTCADYQRVFESINEARAAP